MDYLFTYGTLMHNFDSEVANYLKNESQFLGEAFIPGRLFDVGSYPGLVYIPDYDQLVFGHLFRLKSPSGIFKVLDQYEMMDPVHPENNQYIRVQRPVRFQEKSILSWVYLLQSETTSLPIIESGNYLLYYQRQPKHLQFINIQGNKL